MKTRLLCGLLTLLVLLFPLTACNKKDLLYSITDGSRTVSVLGGSRACYLSVSENGTEIWQTRIYADKTVGTRNGTYGLRLMDLNFDGRNDLVIAITVNGDAVTEQVFLQTATGSYQASSAFDGMCNLASDVQQELVFGFTHSEQTEQDADTGKINRITTDRSTAYSWQGSVLEPRRYVSLTYYSESNLYCYSVADFDASLGTWESSDDRWMSPAEYEKADFAGLYYFK